MKKIFLFWLVLVLVINAIAQNTHVNKTYAEKYRPQIHFSPKAHWMNDPNGMVYFKGTYHLFFQYYPEGTVWGPMHWGHATSKDLFHWQEQPIALYPDKLGYIFSGSVVADVNNTSGFGKKGKVPLVAIFTQHDPLGEKAGTSDFQTQGIAYSLDEGKTWTKYARNPVLQNPGIKDFRDPKVSWHEEIKKWIMTLATKDRISFYSSRNLKNWVKESEFGATMGAHGGVWECPDLFPINVNNKKVWVLLVSINPGGPVGGSATQYFTGDFDGKRFTAHDTTTRWIDFGSDNYAGVTFSNTGNRKIFIGWMSNWLYGTVVPTEKWRSAMTVPRELSLEQIKGSYILKTKPVSEIKYISGITTTIQNIKDEGNNLSKKIGTIKGPARFTITADKIESFAFTFYNKADEKIVVGYDKPSNQYYFDRTNSGNVSFEKDFAAKHYAPRLTSNDHLELTMILDNTSMEIFADDGLTVMTEIFFPDPIFSNVQLQAANNFTIKTLQYTPLKSIWKK